MGIVAALWGCLQNADIILMERSRFAELRMRQGQLVRLIAFIDVVDYKSIKKSQTMTQYLRCYSNIYSLTFVFALLITITGHQLRIPNGCRCLKILYSHLPDGYLHINYRNHRPF